jgi:hypothetical protein
MPIGATRLGYRFLPIPPSDGSGPPRPQYFNSSFEAGINGWTVIPTRIILGTTTILGYPVPGTEPTPVQVVTASGGGPATYLSAIERIDLASDGGTACLKLFNNNLQTSVAGATVYGPAVYSNVAVIAEVGDSITYEWKAVSGGDAYRSIAYLLEKNTGRIIIMFTAAGLSVDAATVWQKQTRTFVEGEAGDYHFVFVSGSQDSTNGKILGARLLIDNVAIVKA